METVQTKVMTEKAYPWPLRCLQVLTNQTCADKSRDQVNLGFVPWPMIEGASLLPDAGSLVHKLVVFNVRIKNNWDPQSLMLLPLGPIWERDPFSASWFYPPPPLGHHHLTMTVVQLCVCGSFKELNAVDVSTECPGWTCHDLPLLLCWWVAWYSIFLNFPLQPLVIISMEINSKIFVYLFSLTKSKIAVSNSVVMRVEYYAYREGPTACST